MKNSPREAIAVVDFGGQYAHLIANRIRRSGVFAEILLPENAAPDVLKNYRGIILSGGPDSCLRKGSPTIDKKVYELGLPILAICYGHQLTMNLLGGKVKKGKEPEYGPAKLKIEGKSALFEKLPKTSTAWMSHWDEVVKLPKNFEKVASTNVCSLAAAVDEERQIFGIQFHPEVVHTEVGEKLLANFVKLTGAKKTWTMKKFLADEIARIKKQVGKRKVFLLVSGGVDSTVAFALLEKALGKKRVFGMLVDHGLMRKDETKQVVESLKKAGFDNLHVEDASGHFLAALRNATEPEDKRRIIGRVFLQTQRKVLKKLNFNPRQWLLGQGTIYPDTIESGGTANADKIKTHHNRVPEIEKMIAKGLIVEPLAQLYKDEVREVGRQLGLPAALVDRHPFPGPGLGVRTICGAEDRADNTNKIETELRRKWGNGKLLPFKSVGVQGDARTFRYPVAIFEKKWDFEKLDRKATEIIQKFEDVNRVVLCLTATEPPRRFAHRETTLTRDRLDVLREADAKVTKILRAKKLYDKVWQMPVVLAPISTDGEHESIILRPVDSTEAMTANFSRIPATVLKEMAKQIASINEIEHVFFDLTNKPPGTIEWE